MTFAARLSVLAAALVLGWASPAHAKPKGCLLAREMVVEQLVCHGVFLREAAARCDPVVRGTWALWRDFDTANGTRLRAQTDTRIKVFKREFPNDWKNVITYFDGRLVTYHRNFPLTQAYCEQVHGLLDDNRKRGWNNFTKQAKTIQEQVSLDYKVCTGSGR